MSPAVTFPSIPLDIVLLALAVLGLTNLGVQLWLLMVSSSGIASQIAGWLENQFGDCCVPTDSLALVRVRGVQALYWVSF